MFSVVPVKAAAVKGPVRGPYAPGLYFVTVCTGSGGDGDGGGKRAVVVGLMGAVSRRRVDECEITCNCCILIILAVIL